MLLAAIRTVAAGLAVSLWVLVVGPPVLIWTVLSRRTRLLYGVAATGVQVGFVLAGIRMRVLGDEHMRSGSAVYACNHSSNVDSPAVFLALRSLFPRVRVLYKRELRALPILVWAFDLAGFVPVERANRDQSQRAIDDAAEALRRGNAFFVFPEGTRSRGGELLPFKKGGFLMAIKAQAPIVPVAVSGGRAAMRKGSPLIWPATVTIRLLPAVPTIGLTLDDRQEVVDRVRAAIQHALPAGA